ncbi:unnamed protein product [Adineta ricciae]|uniref:B box-type domain-containing protein n=1 Tax=Adineta ricciae TaxID=249248 RepID=A0A816E7D6_ADIRI|nr:unnamed protein product [Adineta ricciae]
MSSTLSEKSSCAATCTASSDTLCDGCGKSYCNRHSSKHRERLTKQMEKVLLYHEQLQKLFHNDAKIVLNHPLMKRIDDWEKESILKIQQAAKETRQQLKSALNKYTADMNETFQQISEQLNETRRENDCMESEIRTWLEKLTNLKKDYRTPKTINIRIDEHSPAFINKINLHFVSLDSFCQSIGDIQYDPHTRTILHGPKSGDATIRGILEFTSGTHRFRFQIGKLGIPKWVFFGIISKNTPLQATLYKTPTAYGWAGHHQVWLNGNHYHQYDGFRFEMNNNDVIELSVDCDRRSIRLTNESLAMQHELEVALGRCPFPWVLYIGLYGAKDEIRLQVA